MISELKDRLPRASRHPQATWDRAADYLQRYTPEAARRHKVAVLFGAAAVGLLVASAVYFGPDLRRYLKLRHM